MCFDKGSAKKKLDQYLVIFQVGRLPSVFSKDVLTPDRSPWQLYVLCKQSTPMDVEFMLTDTFELIRPGMSLFKTFEDAGVAVDELLASQALQPAGA